MEDTPEHPMDKPRIGLVIGLFGAFGVGLSLMAPDLFWVGAGICYVAAVGTAVRYRSDLFEFVRLKLPRVPIWESFLIAGMLIGEVSTPSYLIYRRIMVQHVENAPPVTEYSGLSNAQLKQFVIDFSESLRAAQATYNKRSLEVSMNSPDYTSMSDAQRHASWIEYTQRITRVMAENDFDFRSHFFVKAKELDHELTVGRHLSIPTGRIGVNESAIRSELQTGSLAGVSPATDLADYLELLARSLT